jgi:hypothetical protein
MALVLLVLFLGIATSEDRGFASSETGKDSAAFATAAIPNVKTVEKR